LGGPRAGVGAGAGLWASLRGGGGTLTMRGSVAKYYWTNSNSRKRNKRYLKGFGSAGFLFLTVW